MSLVLLFQTSESSLDRFVVYSAVAFAVFTFVLRFALRKRTATPWRAILITGVFIVFGGMLFARWTYELGSPWWVFYGVPALATIFGPPLVFRMSRFEAATYILLAVLMAPAIHTFFSFFLGWHEYMPLFYVPSVWELMHG